MQDDGQPRPLPTSNPTIDAIIAGLIGVYETSIDSPPERW